MSDGVLNIAFTGVTNGATIGAIEIVPVYTDTTPDVAYTHRADGLRYTKTISGTPPVTYTWDLNAGLPVVVQDGSYSYVYGLGLISQTDGSGNQSYFLGNALGSTEKLTDGSGNVVASYKYDVFGAVRSSSGSGWTEYRFTGQQDDASLGMTYLRARYYDPATGRFVTRDPFKGALHNPATLNVFIYAWNDPVNLSDTSGKDPAVATMAAEGTLAVAAATAAVVGSPVIIVGGIIVVAGIGAYIGWENRGAIGAGCAAAGEILTSLFASHDDPNKGNLKRLPDRLIDSLGGEDWTGDAKSKSGKSRADLYYDPATGRIYSVPRRGGEPQYEGICPRAGKTDYDTAAYRAN